MANLRDIFNLAKADGGKFFVMDEQGEPKLVIMDISEYHALLLGKINRDHPDAEKINREITRAQLDEVVHNEALPVRTHAVAPGAVDNREEVIDPSFDFEGPKFDLDDL